MSTIAISFTLAWGEDYDRRYESVMNYIRKQGKTWDETTSFVLVETAKSAADFEKDLYYGSQISSVTDKVLVLNVTSDPGATRGRLDYPSTLKALMPNVAQN